MRTETVTVTTGATGHGTAISGSPIDGEIRQVLVGSEFGTAHVTVAPVASGYSGTAGIFHGAGSVVFGPGAQAPYGKYKSFPVVGGDHVRVIVSGPGYAQAYSKTDKVKIIYAEV